MPLEGHGDTRASILRDGPDAIGCTSAYCGNDPKACPQKYVRMPPEITVPSIVGEHPTEGISIDTLSAIDDSNYDNSVDESYDDSYCYDV